jgi:hypothetical protein
MMDKKRTVCIKVKFEEEFFFDVPEDWDEEEEIEILIETLSDRSNRTWDDADFMVTEVNLEDGRS